MSESIVAAALTAAASLGGGALANATNAGNVSATNAANLQTAMENNRFNSGEATTARAWSDWQGQKGRDFAADQANRAMAFGSNQAEAAYNRQRQLNADAQIYNSAVQAAQQAYQTWSNRQAMDFSQKSMDDQRAFEYKAAQDQRDWQARMSGTAYQRMVADMRAAGLNPILGINSGGASTPSGGIPATTALPGVASSGGGFPVSPGSTHAAQGQAGSSGIPGGHSAQGSLAHLQPARVLDIVGPAVHNAVSLYRAMNEAENIKADVDLKKVGVSRQEADISLIYQELRNKGLTEREIEERIRHIQLQQSSERERPGLLRAQAAEHAASAGHHAESGQTARKLGQKYELETGLMKTFGSTGAPLSGIGMPVQSMGDAISRDIVEPTKRLFNRLFGK